MALYRFRVNPLRGIMICLPPYCLVLYGAQASITNVADIYQRCISFYLSMMMICLPPSQDPPALPPPLLWSAGIYYIDMVDM